MAPLGLGLLLGVGAGAGGGGAPFDETELSGLVAYFDPFEAGTLTLSGASVLAMASRVGAIVGTPSASDKRPTYSATGRNSLPAVSMSSDNLIFSALTNFATGANDLTIVAVAFSNSSGFNFLGGYGAEGTRTAAQIGQWGVGEIASFLFDGDHIDSNENWPAEDHIAIGIVTAGDTQELFIDGVSEVLRTATPLNVGSTAGCLGAYIDGSSASWDGSFQKYMIFNRAITLEERLKIEGKFAEQCNLRALLPVSHPYKAAAPTSALPNITQDYGALIGDSTVAAFSTYQPMEFYYDTPQAEQNLAAEGNGMLAQRQAWQTYADQSRCKWVTIRCGLNDINPSISAADLIAGYQNLVDAVKSRIIGKVIISTLTPFRGRFIDIYGPVDGETCYQRWLDLNEAITGGGATPITGHDGVASSHTDTLSDGSGNLLPAYDHGDEGHINDAGRAIVGASEMAALIAAEAF